MNVLTLLRRHPLIRRPVTPPVAATIAALGEKGFSIYPTGTTQDTPTYRVISPRDHLGRRWSASRFENDLAKILEGTDPYFATESH